MNYSLFLSSIEDLQYQIKSDFDPDYIVGISRGGLIPATFLSYKLNTKLYTLDVELDDMSYTTSNTWMAEDAFNGTKILLVDNINDGKVFNWIMEDWKSSFKPHDEKWISSIFHNNVRFSSLYHQVDSEIESDYSSILNYNEPITFFWKSTII